MNQSLTGRFGRLARLLAIALGAICALTGCSASTPVHAPSTVEEPLPPITWQPYRIQIDDELEIKFWANEELDQVVTVRPDGMISLPYVDDVRAGGLTPTELDAELTALYATELISPELTVIVTEAGGQRIYLSGEVGGQGSLRLVENMTLMQAIQEAGGLLTTARREQILLIRTLPDGERIARAVNLRPVLSGSDLTNDVRLQNNDVIFVPRTRIANVNIFVDQYINSIIPFDGIVSAAVFQSDLFTSDDNTPAPAPEPLDPEPEDP
ncbi:MAG: polysaccharide biosynthesis/export family protein [Acidobacteriota bacterium]